MILPLNWIEAVILSVLKRRKWLISWSIYHCHISWKRSFFDKKHYIVNKKDSLFSQNIWHFDKIKRFWKLGMVHIDPFLCKLGTKIAILEFFTIFFSEPLQHNLLILIEYPLSESVKKGKFVTKIFLSDNVEWSSKRNNKE